MTMQLSSRNQTYWKKFLFSCLLGLAPALLCGQASGEIGRPFITNYSPREYKAHAQNWSILKDRRGVIYFGNSIGLLEYDGVSWRLMQLPNQSVMRSLALTEEGQLLFGSSADLGYITQDDRGQSQMVSLLSVIPERARNFNEIWTIQVTPEGYYFQAREHLYLLRPRAGLSPSPSDWECTIWDPPTGDMFMYSFYLDGTYYLHQREKGLMMVRGDSLVLAPGGEYYAKERIQMMLPLHQPGSQEPRYLMGQFYKGLTIYDGKTVSPFQATPEVQAFLATNLLYKGVLTPEGDIALGSTDKGVAVISVEGELKYIIDRQAGLQDNTVYAMYIDPDNQRELWMGLDKGLAKFETRSPLTLFNDKSGLNSTIISLHRHQGTLFLGTTIGVFYLDGKDGKIRQISGSGEQVFAMMSYGDQLLIPSEGLLTLKDGGIIPVRASEGGEFQTASIHQSILDTTYIFVGLMNGIASLHYEQGKWIEDRRNKDIHESVWSIKEIVPGELWVGTATQGVLKIEYSIDGSGCSIDRIQRFGPAEGLPEGGAKVFNLKGKLYFASKTGVYSPSPTGDGIRHVPELEMVSLGGDHNEYSLNEGFDGKVWVNFGKESALLTYHTEDSFSVYKAPFLPFSESNVFTIYPDKDDITWFATGEGLFRYDGKVKKDYEKDFPTLIRSVIVADDSVLAGGRANLDNLRPTLNYEYNSLTFEFASPFFDQEDKNLYQSYLEGYDPTWGPWGNKTSREYTNLPPGDYTFHARAKNVYGKTGQSAHFSFQVLAPWYQSWWAYLFYALLGASLVYAIVRWRTRQLKSRSEELESAVEARTHELQRRLNELATVNQISRALVSQLHVEELLKLVGEEMQTLFEANVVYIALHDKATNMIHFPYEFGDHNPSRPFGEGLTEKIITTHEPLLVNEDIRTREAHLQTRQFGVVSKSYLGVPIPIGEEILGVLSVQSTQAENKFDEADMRLLHTIASNLGVALHNAQLFEETRQARAAAEEANEAKSTFLSTVSHELRTPLTSVLGFAKIIRKRLDERIFPLISAEEPKIQRTIKQIQDNLQVVVSEGERLTTLINDVLDLAKIEAGKFEWNFISLNMEQVLRHAIAATEGLFQTKPLAFQVEIPENLPPVQGDQDKLIQVIINLLSNAVKFTDQGSVTLRAHTEGAQLIVEVEDTGMGIAREDQQKVFEKFKQVGDTLTDKPQGTGLGLPICKEIVEHHGGNIWVESALGKGSTFYFSLPLAPSESPSPPQLNLDQLVQQLRQPSTHTQGKANGLPQHILIVDDEAHIRTLLRQELETLGYQIEEAENGKVALEFIRNAPPDLIILDVMMPGMNGFDLAAILKNDPATMTIPILILSIIKDKERGYKIGVDRYLTKPIDTEVLFKEVESLLEQGQSHKKVMIVEENESTIKTLSHVLAAKGYQVVEANGANMVEKALAAMPDVIILNSLLSDHEKTLKSLRFEKGLENVLFFIYQ